MPTEKNPLLAVITCHRFRDRADAQRATWVSLVGESAEVRFFLGRGRAKRFDEIILDVPDDYLSLPHKVQEMCRWAIKLGYDYVLKLDDDVYLHPERMLSSDFRHDYVGRLSIPKPGVTPYASGFAHWLSRRAMEVLVEADINDWAEDRWTGAVLDAAGIKLHEENRYHVINVLDPQNLPLTGTEGPRPGNDVIVAAEFDSEMMRDIHLKAITTNDPTD